MTTETYQAVVAVAGVLAAAAMLYRLVLSWTSMDRAERATFALLALAVLIEAFAQATLSEARTGILTAFLLHRVACLLLAVGWGRWVPLSVHHD